MTDPAHIDTAAELALVGCVLFDAGAIDVVATLPEEMHGLARESWATMRRMRDAGLPIDPLTVTDAADSSDAVRRQLPEYLTGALLGCPTADNVEYYAEIVHRHFLTRRCLQISADVQSRAEFGIEGCDLLGDALERYSALDVDQAADGAPVGDLVRERYREICDRQDKIAAGESVRSGYTTGVSSLDQLIGGVEPGLVHVVAARPGMGKTAFGMSLADANSEVGVGVHIFSLEDIRSSYCDRAISRYSGVSSSQLRGAGALSREQAGAVRDAAGLLAKRGCWFVDDRSGIDAREIVRSVRRKRRDNDTRIVIVDYIQILKRGDRQKMHEGITENINVLADAAKRDHMAYVVMSQLSRGIEKRDSKIPRMEDLRESGSLEERSKVIIGILRQSAYDDNRRKDKIELHVLKQNQGVAGGYAEADWHGPTTRIS